ncbi:Wzt carbohydrate-binding domain-containing protein [Leptolyngbya sp. FACHB-321]|uniref:Wzt carbohydrate-binding domain-containing protein n=1 Tax=Leptolyngbya sp. FACHB-321 TaxID=2692807 RepID=UPI001685A966|nr:Wzt carbohydrate-binding domain-containing protein [Leptolyngbya sp. FACHB-321]MBD2036600.1 Wzt carbohydrate-binding domain-containing protein [Leptolyngbya sp. FACHB-321]
MTEQSVQELYDQAFFEALRDGSRQSAAVIVPMILDWIQPQQVVDVGCGDGTWLSMFREHGIEDVLGIDGSYVEPANLQIPVHQFVSWNLSQPVLLDQAFDLAMSLEVAEHLPEESASSFVNSLVRLSDVVLFSAAIPYQGGTHHINEQWPDYWIQRFEERGYIAIDVLRERIWNHPRVEPWYAQNSFIFVRRDRLFRYPKLQELALRSTWSNQSLVHPQIYLNRCVEQSSVSEAESIASENNPSQLIKILNLTCLPVAEIHSGEGITLELEYQLESPVKAAIFNLSLSNASGDIYLDTHVAMDILPDAQKGPHRLQLQIDRLDLIQGHYFINPGIFSPDWQQIYDFHWHRYPLTISADAPQTGMLNPPMRWRTLCSHADQLADAQRLKPV